MIALKVVMIVAAFVLCCSIPEVRSRARVEMMKIVFEADQENIKTENDIGLSNPRLHPYFSKSVERMLWGFDLASSFNWKNCGESSDLLIINSLTVTPDPLSLPGTVSLSFDVTVQDTFTSPLKLDLVLKKYERFFWLTVPCIDNVGSCTYDDICETLASFSCPQSFIENNIPCKCPFTKGSYTLPTTSFSVNRSVPSGKYNLIAQLSSGSQSVNCIEISFEIS